MVFSSLSFLLFFLPIIPIGLTFLPGRLRLPFLLLASLAFYGFGEPVAALFLLLSAAEAFFAARAMVKGTHARLVLILSLVWHVGVLFIFKYLDPILAAFGLRTFSIHLPAGISFYTFQNIAYLADVYRRRAEPSARFSVYAAYIAFFPQLIAGPIERWQDMAPQFERLQAPCKDDLLEGAERFIAGLSMKLLLADPMGRLHAALSASPESAGFLGCWMAALAFAFQLYFDFAGYSVMALGLGRMCSIRLSVNFRHPYAAKDLRDFWQRWHITLSRWFRDYVYIPLGGSRGGKGKAALTLLFTWLLTGIWHGAGWNMALWGLYWGCLLLLERRIPARRGKLAPALYRAFTFLVILVGWTLFSCGDLSTLSQTLRQMFAPDAFLGAKEGAYLVSFLPMLCLCALFCLPALSRIRLPKALRGACCVLLLLLCVASLAGDGYHPFLYFRF